MSSPTPCEVTFGNVVIGPRHPTRVMAVINASPESFYAGSVATTDDGVARAAEKAAAEGADILDIGAMSTAPYKHTRIEPEEEADRLVRAIHAARQACDLPISADTTRASVARVALECGATGINDVTGLSGDEEMARVIADAHCPCVLMASERPGALPLAGEPGEAMVRVLQQIVDAATKAGIARDKIILDPGIGFFRNQSIPWVEWDLEILRNIPEFLGLGHPVLIGASRKSFLGELLNAMDADDRLSGSLAVAGWCVFRGASVLRVHDVKETRDVVTTMERLRNRQ